MSDGGPCGGQGAGATVCGGQGADATSQEGDVRMDQRCSNDSKWALGGAVRRDSEDGTEAIA